MNSLKYVLLVSIALLLSCKKDKVPKSASISCENFELSISYFSKTRYQFKFPSLNPNNNDEIIYNYFDHELSDFRLIKYNMLSKKKIDLVSNLKLITRPKWSKSGKIAFGNYQMNILNDDGSNLKQVTNDVFNLYPSWNNTGTDLFFNHAPTLASYPSYFLKYNLLNESIDTILYDPTNFSGAVNLSDVNGENRIAAITLLDNKFYVATSDLANLNFEPVVEMSSTFGTFNPTGICWSNDNLHVYITIHSEGLFKINTQSKKVEHLMQFCNSRRYKNISCSTDGSFLIAEREEYEPYVNSNGNTTGKVLTSSFVYKIELNTMKEIKIEL